MKCLFLLCIVVGVLIIIVVIFVYVLIEWEDKVKDVWIDGKVEVFLLFNMYLNLFDINIDVKDGVVIFIGKVDSWIDKKFVEELVVGIDGVFEVDN